MRASTFIVIVLAGFAALLTAFAATAPEPVQHDDPAYPLDPNYHQMPPELVEALKRKVPPPPRGWQLTWQCFTPNSSPDKKTSICVCYSQAGCRNLKAANVCIAKLGAITRDVGVCRANETVEKIWVTGG